MSEYLWKLLLRILTEHFTSFLKIQKLAQAIRNTDISNGVPASKVFSRLLTV